MTVRPATRADVEVLVGLAAAEGWNPGLDDPATFWAADPEGFAVAEVDGEVVGGVSAVHWSDDFVFCGLYVVRPDHRHAGIGMQLYRWAVGRGAPSGTGVVAGLDGVVERQADYAASGFRLVHRNLRFEGPAAAWRDVPTTDRPTPERLTVDEVAALDRRAHPSDRPRYLTAWLAQPHARSAAIRSGGQVTGYAVVRPCHRGWKLGPVLASGADDAARLIAALSADLPDDEALVLDVPEPNAAAVDLATDRGMTVQFETARMYDGALPREPELDLLYGVTTFELG